MCHTRTHLDCGVRTHTHARTFWISCCQEQQRGQASCAQSRCTRQEERNEKKEGGGEKRDSKCVLFRRQLRNTHRCLNLTSSHEHNGEITRKLPGRQQDMSRQTSRSSPPRGLIRFEAHPGTLSFAFECTRFPTLIPPKPLQLM